MSVPTTTTTSAQDLRCNEVMPINVEEESPAATVAINKAEPMLSEVAAVPSDPALEGISTRFRGLTTGPSDSCDVVGCSNVHESNKVTMQQLQEDFDTHFESGLEKENSPTGPNSEKLTRKSRKNRRERQPKRDKGMAGAEAWYLVGTGHVVFSPF
eukprot:scaffold324_cov394-Prasinococcus_capsulatus_cf.AAC.10